MKFEDFSARSEEHLFIIAEAGVNHDGSLNKALELVDAALDAGCDAIKFQTWITEKVYSRTQSIKPDYQVENTSAEESEFETIKALEFQFEDFRKISDYCREKGILFFSTPDEPDSAAMLLELGVPLMKTASQDVTNLPFLSHLASLGLPIIYSTGASTLTEMVAGAEAIRACTRDMAILHCVSSYPAPLDQMNLNMIDTLKRMFDCPIGFSDHTTGSGAACAALALGARVFEKHLTLDRNSPGPDHQASMAPGEFRNYVSELRSLRTGLGDGLKRIMPCEENTRLAFRRFLVTRHAMKKGHILSDQDFDVKKVVDGLAPADIGRIVGAKLKCDLDADVVIGFQHIEW